MASYGWCLPADTLSQDAGPPREVQGSQPCAQGHQQGEEGPGWGWEVVYEVETQPSLMAETLRAGQGGFPGAPSQAS